MGPVQIRMNTLHAFPLHFLRHILILSSFLHRGLSSCSLLSEIPLIKVQERSANYDATHFVVFYGLLLIPPSDIQRLILTPVYILPFMWGTKLHTHKKQWTQYPFCIAATFRFHAADVGTKVSELNGSKDSPNLISSYCFFKWIILLDFVIGRKGSPILILSDFPRKIKSRLNSGNTPCISQNQILVFKQIKQFPVDLNMKRHKPNYTTSINCFSLLLTLYIYHVKNTDIYL